MGTTLADIAEKAGVSQATISRVINGKPGVSDEKRESILQLMSAMGLPTPLPRRNDTQLVALISPDLTNAIFPTFVNTLCPMFAQSRILPVLCVYTFAGVAESAFIDMLHELPLYGAVFLAGSYDNNGTDHTIYQPLVDRGVPTVFLNGPSLDVDGLYLQTDVAAGMRMILRHLINLNHHDIGFILGDRTHLPALAMHEAAISFFREYGIPHRPELTSWTLYGIEAGRAAAADLLDKGVTAIVCGNDQLAVGAIQAAQARGPRVPDDISVTGYDDSPLALQSSPLLTTVRQPVAAICQTIVQSLTAMANNPEIAAQRRSLAFQPELIGRNSTAIRARE